MNAAVLSVAIGKWYPRGQARLIKQLHKTATVCDPIMWCNTYPEGSVPIDEIPYTFKPKAFREAQRRGYKIALWMDSAVYPVKNLIPVFAQLNTQPVLALLNGGWQVGQWCCDEALGPLGISREQAMQIPEVTTCMFGLNLGSPEAQRFLNEWDRLSFTFKGHWANEKIIDKIREMKLPFRSVGPVSDDERVYGHRHDQTAASVILHKMGIAGVPMKPWLSYNPDNKDVLAINRGGPDVDKVL